MSARSKSKKNEKTISLRGFERLHKMIALAAVSAAVAPFYYTFLAKQVPFAWLFALILAPLLIYFGHGLQAIYSKLIGVKPEGGTSSYEDMVKRFQPVQASVPLLIVGVLTWLASIGIDRLLQLYADAVVGVFYDKNSLLPFLGALLLGATATLGIVTWFFPYNRIISIRTILPFGIVFLLNFLFNLVGGGIPTVFMAVCLLIFAVLALVLLNQGYVIRAIDRSGTGVVTGQVLKFNTALVGVLIAVFVGVFCIALAILGGFTVLGRMLLFAIRDASMSGSGDDYRDWEEKNQEFVDAIFGSGESGGGAFMLPQNGMVGLFLVFILLIILAIGLFLLLRFNGRALKKLIAWFKKVFRNILHFIQTALDLWNSAVADEDEDQLFSDYVDTTVKMKPQSAADSRPSAVPRNYRAILAGLKTPEERNRYAYQLLVARWSKFLTIRSSDTPNEILGKTEARLENQHLPSITGIFVRFRYAGAHHRPSDDEAEQTLDVMCDMLDDYESGEYHG